MKDIKLKKSWSEVTLAEYDKIMEICYNEDLSEAEKDVALIALLCGKTEDEIWQMPLEDIKFLKIDLMFLTNDFNYPKTLSFKKLKIGDWELEIIPDLQKMTYAQFVDYQTYIRETDKTGSAPKNKAAILSCFFIPKGKKYNDGYDLMELQRVLKDNVSILTYNSVWYFFLQRSKSSLNNSAISLASKLKVLSWMMRKSNPMKGKLKELAKKVRELPLLLG